MLNMYKRLHSLTFASCFLNTQQQTVTLSFVNNVPSVSYCSTVMLYVVFNFLSLAHNLLSVSALSSTSWRES